MLIESLLRRPKGTQVTLHTEHYDFQPRAEDGRHVAEVTDDAHIDRFLSISEGFAEVGDVTPPAPKPEPLLRLKSVPSREAMLAEYGAKFGKTPTGHTATLAGLSKALGYD